MKRRDLIRELLRISETQGLSLTLTEGSRHTKIRIGEWRSVIPRHREIDESLARSIIRNCRAALEGTR